MKNRYNLIKIAAGEEWKRVFHNKQGLGRYAVMPFGLTNAHLSFHEMIDTIFRDMQECIWYLDNILIYSCNTQAKHLVIVQTVLQPCV